MTEIPTHVTREQLMQEHPDFQTRFRELYTYRTTYEGCGPYAPFIEAVTVADTAPSDDNAGTLTDISNRETALWRHPREKQKFTRRVIQAYNVNVIRKVIELLVGFLTRSSPKRDLPGPVGKWMESVTPESHSWDQWLGAEVLSYAVVYTSLPVLFHRPPSAAVTAAQQTAEGADLRATVISPECIVDWRMADTGGFDWLHYTEPVDLTVGPLDPRVTGTRHWYMTQDAWWYVDDLGQPEDKLPVVGSGVWDELPIVIFTIGKTRIKDACTLQRELFNVLSLEQEQERETCFSMLTLPDPGPNKTPRVVSTGSDNAILVPADAKFAPAWLNPEAVALEHYEKKIARLIQQIINEFSLDFDEGATTGVAQSFKMSKVQRLLVHFASQFARCEQSALELVGRLLGAPGDVKSEWPKRFDEADVEREMISLQTLLSLEVGPTFSAEARYRAAVTAMPDMDEETLGKGWDEIEAASEDEAAAIERGELLPNGDPIPEPPVPVQPGEQPMTQTIEPDPAEAR